MIYAVAATTILQLGVMYVPFAQRFLGSKSLDAGTFMLCMAICSIPFLGLELEKWIVRRRSQRSEVSYL